MRSKNSKAFYKPELDVLRATAFILVFAHHLGTVIPNDTLQRIFEIGLQIFFLLSAYLITELLLKERNKTGKVHIRFFYIRRILRIWPLYLFLVCGVAFASRYVSIVNFPPEPCFLYFALMAANWYIVMHGFIASSVGQLWSISVEEQFYLLSPIVSSIFAEKGLAIISGCTLVASYIALMLLGMHHATDAAVRANSFVEFQFFALGTFLALYFRHRKNDISLLFRAIYLGLALGAGWIAVAHFQIIGPDGIGPLQLIGGYALLALATVLIFLAFLDLHISPRMNFILYLGKISYGLYAYHLIALSVSRIVLLHVSRRLTTDGSSKAGDIAYAILALTLTIALASVSFKFLELPFLRLKSRFTFIKSRDDSATQAITS